MNSEDSPRPKRKEDIMRNSPLDSICSDSRRSFLKKAMTTGATGAGLAFLVDSASLFAQDKKQSSGVLSKGDAALLSFAAAAEILESDFWVQYNELGGIQDDEVPGG